MLKQFLALKFLKIFVKFPTIFLCLLLRTFFAKTFESVVFWYHLSTMYYYIRMKYMIPYIRMKYMIPHIRMKYMILYIRMKYMIPCFT